MDQQADITIKNTTAPASLSGSTKVAAKTPGQLSQLFASLLPGIFLIGYNVGTGSVTAMSKAGANFGTDLLWAVLVSCVMTFYLMSLCSRFTMVTGMTLMEGFRRHVHPMFGLAVLVVLSSIILSALIGVLGIISEVLHVWLATLTEQGVSQTVCAGLTALVLLVLITNGDTALFEKLLALLVAIMAIAFIVTMVVEFPGWSTVVSGLVPSIPDQATNSDNHPMVVVAGVVGTTVSVFVLVIRTGLIKEKRWSISDVKVERRDAAVSATLMFIVSAAVMITAAATLHQQGIPLNRIAEMIPMLEPVFGSLALSVFVVGIVAAGLSSHIPNLLVIPWIIDDYRGKPRNTRTQRNRIILVLLSLFSFAGASLGFKPVFLMLLSQASISVVLPLILCALVFLTSRKSIMGEYANTRKDAVCLTVILLFAFYMSSRAVFGLIADLSQ